MRLAHVMLIALAAVAARPARLAAQDRFTVSPRRTRIDFVSAKSIVEAQRRAAKATMEGTTVFTAPDKQTTYVIVARTVPSAVERHARWDDIVTVRRGSGSVRVGKSVTGARVLAPGQRRGGTLTDPYELHLGPGDVVRIPASVPHAFSPDSGTVFEYFITKVRRPNLPLD